MPPRSRKPAPESPKSSKLEPKPDSRSGPKSKTDPKSTTKPDTARSRATRQKSKASMAIRTAASNSTGGSSGRTAAQPAARPAGRSAPRATKAPLLPPAMRDFIKQRTIEVAGLILASSGLLLILVLLTYERGDPSWNTAVNPEANPKIANILGLPGAYVADLLMQWVGVASYLLGGIVMAWGLRIMSHRGLSRLPLRVFLAMVGVLLASIFFAQVPAFPGWQLTHGHLGGTAGAILLAALSKLTGGLLDILDRSLLAMIAGGVSAISIIGALDLSLRDWRDGARGIGWAVGAAGRGAPGAGGMGGGGGRGGLPPVPGAPPLRGPPGVFPAPPGGGGPE